MSVLLDVLMYFASVFGGVALFCVICLGVGKMFDRRYLRKCREMGGHNGDHDWDVFVDGYDMQKTCKICGKTKDYNWR